MEKDQINSPKNIKILIDEEEESKKEDDHTWIENMMEIIEYINFRIYFFWN